MSTFYALIPRDQDAHDAALELLAQGVQPDDISLITHSSYTDHHSATIPEIPPLSDATELVGAPDDPITDPFAPGDAYIDVGLRTGLSPVGGGISTHDRGRNVDTVDQADDSQALAEEDLEPIDMHAPAAHELDDLDLAVRTGFPTVVPVADDFVDQTPPSAENLDLRLDALVVEGLGVVMGGGDLATAALDFKTNGESNGEAAMEAHLRTEGVPEDVAEQFVRGFREGGSILAVLLNPAEVPSGAIEGIAERNHASLLGTYAGPRYHDFGREGPYAG